MVPGGRQSCETNTGDTIPLMSKRLRDIYGNPAVAESGLNLPGCGDSRLSLGSLNLKTV